MHPAKEEGKMVQFQLQFQNLILEDFKEDGNDVSGHNPTANINVGIRNRPSISIAITFDKGPISSTLCELTDCNPHQHLKGALLLSLPLGQFPKMASYDAAKLEGVCRTMVQDHFDPENQKVLEDLFHSSSSQFFLVAPALKPWNKKTEVFFKVAFVIWATEDFFTRSLSSSMPLELTKEHFSDFKRFLVNIMTGMYRNTDGIPNLDIPFLNGLLKAWFTLYTDLKSQVAGYEKYHHIFLKEVLNWIRTYKVCSLYMGMDWEPTNQPYTMLKLFGGQKIFMELIQLLTATYVEETTRNHMFLALFRESADLICNLVNDIVKVTIVQEGSQVFRNALLSEIMRKGTTFDAALEQHLLVINNEILDLQKTAEGLLQEFGNSEPVQKYVKNTMFYVDGTIRYLLSQEKYGKCDYKIMKVIQIGSETV